MNTNHDLAIYTNGLEKARLSKTGSLFLKCLDTVPVNQAESGHYNSTGYNAGHALGLMVKRYKRCWWNIPFTHKKRSL